MDTKKIQYYYNILDLPENASYENIHKKYVELSKKFHPDKCQNLPTEELKNAEEKFKLIHEAYKNLQEFNAKNFSIRNEPNKQKDPKYIEKALFIKGQKLYNEGDINNAMETFLNIHRINEEEPEYIRYIVKCLMTKERRMHEAKEYCLKLIKLEYYNSENFYLMGKIYKNANLNSAAVQYFKKAKDMGFNKHKVECELEELEPKGIKKIIKIFKQ